ncbi:hypothetical protein VPHD480_0386 [Vibrio phage D480]
MVFNGSMTDSKPVGLSSNLSVPARFKIVIILQTNQYFLFEEKTKRLQCLNTKSYLWGAEV